MARIKTGWSLLCALAILASGSVAQAGPIDFTFATTPTPGTITQPGSMGGTATLTLTGKTGSGNAALPPGTDIVFGDISVASSLSNSPLSTATFSDTYSFALAITDSQNGMTKTVTISGTLSGTVNGSAADEQVNINNTYSMPLIQTVKIGDDLYTIDVSGAGSYTHPGPSNDGTFGAHVSGVIVPEPASMTLLGIGVPLVCGGAWLRRRKGLLSV